jgi:TRAP-type mannitol/chloroaromatic compound transport system substrate-binding protein
MAQHEIKLVIVYGVNKLLEVKGTEIVDAVKVAAMGLFGISPSEQNQYVLKAKVDDREQQLDEAKTVEYYHLHDEQKVTLAAGTPYGEI